jgi:hypothetical protein
MDLSSYACSPSIQQSQRLSQEDLEDAARLVESSSRASATEPGLHERWQLQGFCAYAHWWFLGHTFFQAPVRPGREPPMIRVAKNSSIRMAWVLDVRGDARVHQKRGGRVPLVLPRPLPEKLSPFPGLQLNCYQTVTFLSRSCGIMERTILAASSRVVPFR